MHDSVLVGNITVTSRLVEAIREGYSRVTDVPNAVCSVTLVTLLDQNRDTQWGIIWFSKHNVPIESIFRVDGIELALSPDIQTQLHGRTVDFVDGKVQVY